MTRNPGPPALPGLGGAPQSSAPPLAMNAEVLLASGLRAQESGRLEEAERLFRQAMLAAPRDARMSAHLAVMFLEQGRNADAVPLLDQSLALDPKQPGMLVNRGNALIALDRFEEGMTSYNLAIAQQPANARAEAFNNLGVYLQSLGRFPEAVDCYAKALVLDPTLPEAWGNKGIAYLSDGKAAEALEAFDKAIALKPDYADALTNRGTALQQLMRLDEALESFDRALALQPDTADIWNNRAVALQTLRRFDDAAQASAKALEIGGADADAWINQGVAMAGMNRLDEAMEAYDKASDVRPNDAAAWNNRGLALEAMGRFDDAQKSYEQALALKPGYADAIWNKALSLLLSGDYEKGWELFEWRWKRAGPVEQPRDFGVPPWLGETSLEGKTLLIWAEQGFGDTLQMLRYVPILADRGVTVNLLAPAEVLDLAGTVRGIGKMSSTMGGLTSFDAHIPTMSLPLAMRTRLDTVPAGTPYLSVPKAAADRWAAALGPGRRRRVGLAWSGNAQHRNDHNRSIPLARLQPLLDADAEFHSLQKEMRPADAEVFKAHGGIASHAKALKSFADTAALIDRMDVVVAVDTSVAHLAGALGKPTLLLLPFAPDYRWGHQGEASPWYPSMRLLRQRKTGDWGPVIDEAVRALEA